MSLEQISGDSITNESDGEGEMRLMARVLRFEAVQVWRIAGG